MLVCPGCGGRNSPDLDVCPFCRRRLGAHANGAGVLRPRRRSSIVLAMVVLALLVSVALLVLARSPFGV
jgi:hypothetical protein